MPPKHRDQLLGELRSLQDHAAQLYREEGLVDDDIDIDIHIDPPPVLPLSSEDYALSQGGTEQEGGWGPPDQRSRAIVSTTGDDLGTASGRMARLQRSFSDMKRQRDVALSRCKQVRGALL